MVGLALTEKAIVAVRLDGGPNAHRVQFPWRIGNPVNGRCGTYQGLTDDQDSLC